MPNSRENNGFTISENGTALDKQGHKMRAILVGYLLASTNGVYGHES